MRRTPRARLLGMVVCTAALAAAVLTAADRNPLTIYFIDVEGGQSTLIVTPERQTMLVDAGFPGPADRDVNRIMSVFADVGVTALDYLFITHFHQDHVGGAAGIAARVPVTTFVDHGDPVVSDPIYREPDRRAYDAYSAARGNKPHLHPSPGERLRLKGIDVVITNGAGNMLSKPLPGGGQKNAACETYQKHEDDPGENSNSLGFWLRYGKFRFLDVGDLNWNKLGELVCPRNELGQIDAYLVSHHGNLDSNVPEFVAAIRPRIAVLNNGAMKGGAAATFATLRQFPFVEDVWQLHRSTNQGAENFADERIANLDTETAHWLKLTADRDGSFTVVNSRTGSSKTYLASR